MCAVCAEPLSDLTDMERPDEVPEVVPVDDAPVADMPDQPDRVHDAVPVDDAPDAEMPDEDVQPRLPDRSFNVAHQPIQNPTHIPDDGRLIERQLCRVDQLKREDVINTVNRKQNKNNDRVPLVTTYTNLLPDLHKIVRKHMRILHKSDRMKEVFQQPPMVAYRRDRNLCDVLVHGKTNALVKKTASRCIDDCPMCPVISEDNVKDTLGQKSYTVARGATCRQRNVIYAIRCRPCNMVVYVGETERQLQERMKEHLRYVRLNKEKPINEHFSMASHTASDLQFVILQKLYDAGRIERRIRESAWIQRLKTIAPFGCNLKDARSQATSFDIL